MVHPALTETGIIPAYAGSTKRSSKACCAARDHPRIRGEHYARNAAADAGWGSSPHTRGALYGTPSTMTSHGIIPAYAGSTSGHYLADIDFGDHPRIRGEHATISISPLLQLGSSPHTRGAPESPRHKRNPGGIIPAYAGSTPFLVRPTSIPWDHPRIRGEHSMSRLQLPRTEGSSPHTRGALYRELQSACLDGIIPAYAGSTFFLLSFNFLCRDHPRIRGEHPAGRVVPASGPGSSPHTRGARTYRPRNRP